MQIIEKEKMKYTADNYSKKESIARADLILTANIKELGTIEPEGMGQIYFYNTEIEGIEIEKGKLDSKSLIIGYQVISFDKGKRREIPQKGKKYKFYITVAEGGKTHKAFKITDI